MKVLVLASSSSSVCTMRRDLIQHLAALGHTVVAAGDEPEEKWAGKFEEMGASYRQITVSRNGVNPLDDIKTLRSIKSLLRQERPDKIFVNLAKTISYGCMAAKQVGIKEIYPMVGGLGSIFRGHGAKNTVVKFVMSQLYKQAFNHAKRVFFQNNDDMRTLADMGVVDPAKVVMIHGSGVNLARFQPSPYPEKPAFLFVGRLIKDKGVVEYLEACKKVKQSHPDARCLLVGPLDTNPSALSKEELDAYVDAGYVEYFGPQADVRPYIAQCSVFVLPSYHEGTPRSVLECLACRRPVITTNAPGCRETVVDGTNGFLVPVMDSDAVAQKMEYFINNPAEIERMGEESLLMARDVFDVNKVNKSICQTMGLQ